MIKVLALTAATFLAIGCQYTDKAACEAAGGSWGYSSAGHYSGAKLGDCTEKGDTKPFGTVKN